MLQADLAQLGLYAGQLNEAPPVPHLLCLAETGRAEACYSRSQRPVCSLLDGP